MEKKSEVVKSVTSTLRGWGKAVGEGGGGGERGEEFEGRAYERVKNEAPRYACSSSERGRGPRWDCVCRCDCRYEFDCGYGVNVSLDVMEGSGCDRLLLRGLDAIWMLFYPVSFRDGLQI